MTSKKEERSFYNTIYLMAFHKEATFFYVNDCDVIIDHLKKTFWGKNLINRVKLLVKLLYYDSISNPLYKISLRNKAEKIRLHFSPHSQ